MTDETGVQDVQIGGQPAERQARLAFIGCGRFATSHIFPVLHMVPEIDLAAVCDIDQARAERTTRVFGARRYYADMQEMLDKEALDGVFVIGPPQQQFALAPPVLRRGLPVYLEKPTALSSADARLLAETADAHGTWGQVGFMRRFAYVYRMAKEVVQRSDFGALRTIKCQFAQGPWETMWGLPSVMASFLKGPLCHIFDLVRFFAGDFRSVQALYREFEPGECAFAVNIELASGIIGQLDLNSGACQEQSRDIVEVWQLVGERTHLVCEDMMTLRWQGRDDFVTSVPEAGRYVHAFRPAFLGFRQAGAAFGYLGEVRRFARRCLGLLDAGPDLWDGYQALRIAEAIETSALARRVVELDV